jgi:tRNA1(Val) A37 N6-methylase TrmN6
VRGTFSLFQSHLDLAHDYWGRLLLPGDSAIDATCGNGHDSIYLATRCLTKVSGSLYLMDLQEEALVNTKRRLEAELDADVFQRVTFVRQCHSQFPEVIPNESVKLVVYNLGYLPGSDKETKTQLMTTMESLRSALKLVARGGAISVTCYPGHEEGALEEESLLQFCRELDPRRWSCCHHRWLNRRQSPSLLLIQSAVE